MQHFFNVEMAQDYGVEKAIILNNLFYWCKENEANDRNVYKGRAYTYNTADAYALLFPYFKPRKIAELLRQLECDELIMSAQIHGTNRVKSYTLTDKALVYFEAPNIQKTVPSNIRKSDNGTYKNATMEYTEIEQCTITNNKQQIINTDVETQAPKATQHKSVKYLLSLPLDEQYKLVNDYAKEQGLEFDVPYFVDWWTARKWIPKGRTKPLSDWQATARNWARREKSYKQQQSTGSNIYGNENECSKTYAHVWDNQTLDIFKKKH